MTSGHVGHFKIARLVPAFLIGKKVWEDEKFFFDYSGEKIANGVVMEQEWKTFFSAKNSFWCILRYQILFVCELRYLHFQTNEVV